MESDADEIRKEALPEEREWSEPDRAGLEFVETGSVHEALDFIPIVPFRLKSGGG
jgi:hypothetical protein